MCLLFTDCHLGIDTSTEFLLFGITW